MGGRGSNSMDRIVRGGNAKPTSTTDKWKKETRKLKGRQNKTETGHVDSAGQYFIFKDAGDRWRLYDLKADKMVSMGRGSDLVFSKMSDAKVYAKQLRKQ